VEPPVPQAIAVLTVATNRYLDYWKDMAESADRSLSPGSRLVFYVFTDRPEEAQLVGKSLLRSTVVPIQIPPLGWPEATLLRYALFRDSWNLVNEELVIHLDADMLVTSRTLIHPAPTEWPNGIALVRHPGFRRPKFMQRLRLYFESPTMLKGDVQMRIRLGALGSWETAPESKAYVPRRMRHTYVCGGTWMGCRNSIGQMIRTLADRTQDDLNSGLIATWHDESHLNWFASTHSVELMDSQKCYAPGYPNLKDLTAEIVAVDKGANRTR